MRATAKKKKSEDSLSTEGGAGAGSAVGSQGHKNYFTTKFEKRGLQLYSIFQQVVQLQARKGEENMGLSLAQQIVRQELAGTLKSNCLSVDTTFVMHRIYYMTRVPCTNTHAGVACMAIARQGVLSEAEAKDLS